MKIKFLSIWIACFVITSVFSQESLNDYKYVIVADKFDFLNEKNQYQLNSLTQFLFNKYGFETIMEGTTYPEDLIRNRCLALKSNVLKESGLFKSKLKVELKDCNDKIVYTSEVGESREKEYKTAYNFALRDAFKSFEVLNYEYKPRDNLTILATPETTAKSEVTQEIEQLKQEIQNLKKEKQVEVVKVEKPTAVTPVVKPEPIAAKAEKAFENDVIEGFSDILYAQEIENGFQLVDSSPKVVYRIKKTGQANLFLVDGENAIIYKKGDTWIYELNTDEGIKQKELNIKF
jgi:hypothetical protein